MTETLLLALGAVAVTSAVGLALAIHARQLHQQNERWAALAARHRLAFVPRSWFGEPPSLEGRVDGTWVRITIVKRGSSKNQVQYTAVFAASPHPLPTGLVVRGRTLTDGIAALVGIGGISTGDPAIDGAAHVQGEDEAEVTAVLTHPGVRAHLAELLDSHEPNRIEHGGVVVEERGAADRWLDDNLRLALDVADALGRAAAAPWHRLVQDTGLTMQVTPTGIVLAGSLDGFTCEVQSLRGPLDEPRTEVRFALPGGLPRFEVHLLEPDDRAEQLGDPVLDGLVRVDTTDLAAVRAWFTRSEADAADLRGTLLAVVHGRPGSRVTHDEVRVVAPGATVAIASNLLDEGRALANALRRVGAALQG